MENIAGLNPLEVLQFTINNKNWIKGIDLSVKYLKKYGMNKIVDYFDINGIEIDDEKIKTLKYEQIALTLLALGLINKRNYRTMMRISKRRERLINKKEIGYMEIRDCQKLIKNAMEILQN